MESDIMESRMSLVMETCLFSSIMQVQNLSKEKLSFYADYILQARKHLDIALDDQADDQDKPLANFFQTSVHSALDYKQRWCRS